MLNAEQILEQGLVKTENSKGKPAQVGYDLSVKSINLFVLFSKFFFVTTL